MSASDLPRTSGTRPRSRPRLSGIRGLQGKEPTDPVVGAGRSGPDRFNPVPRAFGRAELQRAGKKGDRRIGIGRDREPPTVSRSRLPRSLLWRWLQHRSRPGRLRLRLRLRNRSVMAHSSSPRGEPPVEKVRSGQDSATTSSMSDICSSIQSPGVLERISSLSPRARRARSSGAIVRASWIASA
jgi:hypothetical protein